LHEGQQRIDMLPVNLPGCYQLVELFSHIGIRSF
jgi:hypothetical protein